MSATETTERPNQYFIQEGLVLEKLQEAGYWSSLYGLSLNKLQPIDNMHDVAKHLAQAEAGSHRKCLRHMRVWLIIQAPIYWWSEFDTYKVGLTRNSSSTMHKPRGHITFINGTPEASIRVFMEIRQNFMEGKISIKEFKAGVPGGLILQSVVDPNYENLRTIIRDRRTHRLPEWQDFCTQIMREVDHPELLTIKE